MFDTDDDDDAFRVHFSLFDTLGFDVLHCQMSMIMFLHYLVMGYIMEYLETL